MEVEAVVIGAGGGGACGGAPSRRTGARGRRPRTGKDDRNPDFVTKFRGHTCRNVLSAGQPEGAPVRGGPQATLSLLRVTQRAGQRDRKADRRDDRRAIAKTGGAMEARSRQRRRRPGLADESGGGRARTRGRMG